MHCERCQREVSGELKVSDHELMEGLWVVAITATPDRNWICCDSCNQIVCHNCCQHPESGYCDRCITR